MRGKSVALMLALAALGTMPQVAAPAPRERDTRPRKFTDARKAEAQAKRERKAAKRRGT